MPSFHSFPLHPSVLKPHFHLSLSEVQVDSDLVPPQSGQIVMVGELRFQLPQLLLGERRALFPRFAVRVDLEVGVLDICERKGRSREITLSVHDESIFQFIL